MLQICTPSPPAITSWSMLMMCSWSFSLQILPLPVKIQHLSSWAFTNDFCLNPSKTHELVPMGSRRPIDQPSPLPNVERVTSMSILGVISFFFPLCPIRITFAGAFTVSSYPNLASSVHIISCVECCIKITTKLNNFEWSTSSNYQYNELIYFLFFFGLFTVCIEEFFLGLALHQWPYYICTPCFSFVLLLHH